MRQFKSQADLKRLRRIALVAQGLTQSKPFGSGKSGAKKAINHLGYVQLDSISVVERAHHHVLFSRIPNFKPEMTNQLLVAGDIFEYWSHAAALLPINDYRFSLPYKHAIKNGKVHWFKNPDKKLMAELLVRIRNEGPLRARDIVSDTGPKSGWWDWKPAKKALEQLYMQGDLMVCDRQGFQKTYDLTERVLPSHVNTQVPSIEEFAEHLIDQQFRCHGVVSLKGITYLRRNNALRDTVKRLVNERILSGDIQQIQFLNGDTYLVESQALEKPLPRVTNKLHILSPFDNSVIQRERLSALFGFEYQIECYVPEVKRQFGYFSLPLLFRDRFIGRMDCKVHRKIKQLEIKSLHFETQYDEPSRIVQAFGEALPAFMLFQGCDSVETPIKGEPLIDFVSKRLADTASC